MSSTKSAMLGSRSKGVIRNRKSLLKEAKANSLFSNAHSEFENYLSGVGKNLQTEDQLATIEVKVQKSLSLIPDQIEGLNLLSRISLERGECEEAKSILSRALRISPDSPSNNFTLAQIYIGNEQYTKAIRHLTLALKHAPNTDQIMGVIAYAHLKNDNRIDAYIIYRRLCFSGNGFSGDSFNHDSVKIDTGYHAALVECLKRAEVHNYSVQMELDLIRVLDFDDVEFDQLSNVVSSLLIQKYGLNLKDNVLELMNLVDDALLKKCLQNMTIRDATIERFIWLVRATLLKECVDLDRIPESLLDLIYSIGVYCHTNEYVFAVKDSEDKMVQYLLATVAMIVKVGEPEGKIIGGLALLSMYIPVVELCDIMELELENFEGWHATGHRLRLKCIAEARNEQKYVKKLFEQGEFERGELEEGAVGTHSKMMQVQYEENPYPRWATISKFPANDYIRAISTELPELARILNVGNVGNVDDVGNTNEVSLNRKPKKMLVAGCGTGRHSVQLALAYPYLVVEAIDVSRRSLAYGMHKAEEFGLINLQFRYQDLLTLVVPDDARYDAIECSGVLHHLEDPAAGLQSLVKVLRPNGIMKLGLYSKRAREHVLSARSCIAQEGFSEAILPNIRQVRSNITEGRWGEDVAKVALSPDFFSTSGCKDLLFHFHEVNYTPLLIRKMLQDSELHFLGFVHLPPSVKKAYRQRFCDDRHLINLENWELFEKDNPHLFTGMYQFYCCKKLDL